MNIPKGGKHGIIRLGMSILSEFSRNVAGNISGCGMVNGVEGDSPVESRQKCSPCLVYSAVHI